MTHCALCVAHANKYLSLCHVSCTAIQIRTVPPDIRQKLQSIVQDPHNVTDNWDEKYCEEIFHRRYDL